MAVPPPRNHAASHDLRVRQSAIVSLAWKREYRRIPGRHGRSTRNSPTPGEIFESPITSIFTLRLEKIRMKRRSIIRFGSSWGKYTKTYLASLLRELGL